MNIGDYVRTDDGYIAKYIGKNKDKYVLGKHYNFDGTIRDVKYQEVDSDNFLWEEELKYIIKTSPNIIDLIEVGDYVNGSKVKEINNSSENPIYHFVIVDNASTTYSTIYKNEICSILTKEQFESMEYKL